MNIELNIKPLSVNQVWQGKRFKTELYKKYESDMLLILPKTKESFSDMLRIELFFGFSYTLSDIDNPVKPVLDILQKKYGFNDKHIFELNIKKIIVKKGKEFISIQIHDLLPFK
jgi:Holliday junction resolvase RusA-like endonuclease